MFALNALAIGLNLLIWGGHALWPWRLAQAPSSQRLTWARAALPAFGLALTATVLAVRYDPDAALVWGLRGWSSGSPTARVLLVMALVVALADAVLWFGAEKLDARAWRLLGLFGAAGLVVATYGAELLRIGWGPVPGPARLWAAVALRLPLALAAAELTLGAPRRWTLGAGPALVVAFLLWPAALRVALIADLPTLTAAAALLAVAGFLPPRYRRPAGAAGFLLAVLFLARSAAVSAILGGGDRLPIELLQP